MRTIFKCLALMLFLSCAASAWGKDRAVLKKDSDTQYHVDVIIEAALQPGAAVTAGLYVVDGGKRKLLQKFNGTATTAGAVTTFPIPLPAPPGEDDTYVVSVFEFPTAAGSFNYELPVTKLLTASLAGANAQCRTGLLLKLSSPDYTRADWEKIDQYIRGHSQNPDGLATVSVVNGTTNSVLGLDSAVAQTSFESVPSTGQMNVCLKTRAQLPQQSYNATVTFRNPPTTDLAVVSESGLTGVSAPPLPTMADDNGAPGQRGMERNLDFGVSFTSSVGEKEQPDKSKTIERTTRGTFDLRAAPWLYVGARKHFDRDQTRYHYFTPFFVDAAVSTGKIDKDTLSMNRVVLGAEYELRYYPFEKNAQTGNTRTTPYQSAHRFILRGTHASDRDFKQLEYVGTFEYQPVLGSLNHPLYLRWKNESGRRVEGDYGYEIKPRFGFSLGRTYARRDPAEAVTVSPNVRRFHAGLDMTFNVTRYVTLSVSDTFYLRGEADDDRFHNYFKGSVEAPLGRPFGDTVHSMFVSFERGNQPPFASRDVNAVKMGYRIRSEGWFNRFR